MAAIGPRGCNRFYSGSYESTHTGDGQMDGRTRTEVYEFVRSNVVKHHLSGKFSLVNVR